MIDNQVQVGLLLSLESLKRSQEPQDVRRLLLTGLSVDPLLETVLHIGEAGGIEQFAVDAGKGIMLSGDDKGRLRTWRDTPAGIQQSSVATLAMPGFNSLVLGPTGDRIAGVSDGQITLYEGGSQLVVQTLPVSNEDEFALMRFSGNGRRLIVADSGDTLSIWTCRAVSLSAIRLEWSRRIVFAR